MIPTPSTSHVSFDRVYEPAEDSFLLLDTLSSASETAFLHDHFPSTHAPPLVVEVGTGSGVVLAFVAANANTIFGRRDVLTLGTDINSFAAKAAQQTVQDAWKESAAEAARGPLNVVNADLVSPFRSHTIDVLIFNPPYVPSEEVPDAELYQDPTSAHSFERDSHLLALSYAGGADGMEVTDKLFEEIPRVLNEGRGVGYILLCAQNKPEVVKDRIRNWGSGWKVETVGSSGKKAGWEKLQIIRIWRDGTE